MKTILKTDITVKDICVDGIWDGKNPHCFINVDNKFKRIFIKHKKK